MLAAVAIEERVPVGHLVITCRQCHSPGGQPSCGRDYSLGLKSLRSIDAIGPLSGTLTAGTFGRA
jgi:hypothetical protein